MISPERLVLLTCAAATWWMTGLAWFVQVVHYPLFKYVGRDEFEHYHAQHVRRTMPVVLFPMVLELLMSMLIALTSYGQNPVLDTAGAFCALFIWAITWFRQIVDHDHLAKGFEHNHHQRLLQGNAVRTWAWTMHAVIVGLQCLYQS